MIVVGLSMNYAGKEKVPSFGLAKPAFAGEHALDGVQGACKTETDDLLVKRVLRFGDELKVSPDEPDLADHLAQCRIEPSAPSQRPVQAALEVLQEPHCATPTPSPGSSPYA